MFSDRRSSRIRTLLAAGFAVGCIIAVSAPHAACQTSSTLASNAQVVANYGKLPLRFEANHGQTDKSVKFLSRGNGYELYLTGPEAVLSLHKSIASTAGNRVATNLLRMQLVGASEHPEPVGPVGLDRLPGVANYMLGSDASQWQTNIPTYARVRYSSVYPGVDLDYYGNQQQLEYDFVVAPGANPATIRLHFDGAEKLKLAKGNLAVAVSRSDGSIAFHKPVVYQMVDGRRRSIAGRFALLAGNSVGFVLGRYDHARPLVIDPTLIYSTYLGGSNSDTISAIAVDSSGAAYLTGVTFSTDYPVTPGVLQTAFSTAFVTKLNASGTALVYSTFLGGTASSSPANTGSSIAVDSSGNAYLAGSTYASNFPVTTGAFQTTDKAATGHGSIGFVAKINPTGTKLLYSTFLGSSLTGGANALAVDSSGDAYVAGYTYGTDFPTTVGAFQTANNSANDSGWNEYVAKLNPAGSSLTYATCIGGSGDYGSPAGIALAVDSPGDAYITATVLSTNFPVTAGAYQSTNKATGQGNMTLAKVNPTGSKLLYATYLGSTSSPYGDDVTTGLKVDSAGNAYLAGSTHETTYPVTTGAFQTTNKTGVSGASTGFITKMNPTGTALVYSTYLGGSQRDSIGGLTLDSSGDVYVTGSAQSTDFPVTKNAYQSTNLASSNNGAVVFLTELNPAGTAELFSTYFGGANSFSDTGYGVALGSSGAVYFAGITSASNFPITPGAYKSTFNSQNFTTGFVAELTLGTGPTTLPTAAILTSSANPAVTGSNLTFSVSVYPTTGAAIPTGNAVFNIDQVNVATVALNSHGYANYTTKTPLSLGQHAILASYTGSTTYSASASNITESITSARPIITPPGGVYPAAQLVTITDKTPGTTLHYTTDGTTPTSASTKYTGPILVSTAEFLSAVAVLANAPNSAVATASYQLLTAPTVLAVPASAIATPSATLNALVRTYGMVGSYYFVYGTSATALTSSTPKTALGTSGLGGRISFVPVSVSAKLTTLKTKTTYYYQVVITTPAGTSSGTVLSFTTN